MSNTSKQLQLLIQEKIEHVYMVINLPDNLAVKVLKGENYKNGSDYSDLYLLS